MNNPAPLQATASSWLPFPENKPDDHDWANDFIALSPNPNFIQKFSCNSNIPRYHSIQAIWVGTTFVNHSWQPIVVDYYLQLPPIPVAKLAILNHN